MLALNSSRSSAWVLLSAPTRSQQASAFAVMWWPISRECKWCMGVNCLISSILLSKLKTFLLHLMSMLIPNAHQFSLSRSPYFLRWNSWETWQTWGVVLPANRWLDGIKNYSACFSDERTLMRMNYKCSDLHTNPHYILHTGLLIRSHRAWWLGCISAARI